MPLEMALDLAVLGLYDIFIYAGGLDTHWSAFHNLQPAVSGCTCLPCAVMHTRTVLSATLGWSMTCLSNRAWSQLPCCTVHPIAGCAPGKHSNK